MDTSFLLSIAGNILDLSQTVDVYLFLAFIMLFLFELVAVLPVFISRIIRFLIFIFYPFVSLLLRLTTLVKKRLETKTYRRISLDELSETLNLTAVEKKEEKRILQGIVNFGRIRVDEIMKPRVDMMAVDFKSNR